MAKSPAQLDREIATALKKKNAVTAARKTMTKAAEAAAAYNSRVAQIRASMDSSSREFASAMSVASLEYERAMAADIGARKARKLGAGMKRL